MNAGDFHEKVWKEGGTDENPFRLVRIDYDEDIGLVSLNDGRLLFSTWDTNNVSSCDKLPRITLPYGWAFGFFGEEHSWNDVISYVRVNYDWDKKTIEFPEECDDAALCEMLQKARHSTKPFKLHYTGRVVYLLKDLAATLGVDYERAVAVTADKVDYLSLNDEPGFWYSDPKAGPDDNWGQWGYALHDAVEMMNLPGHEELEPKSALKQAASNHGIPYGDEMGDFVRWALKQL